MSTSQTFTATAAGPVRADLISHAGTVTVTVDPTITHAVITVSTGHDDGPLADAVRGATMREHRSETPDRITVRVPETETDTLTTGTSTYNFGGGTTTVRQNFGTIRGSVTGMVIDRGDIIVGGRTILSNGRVAVPQGTVVRDGGTGTITLDVTLPSTRSSVRLETTSADLTVRGDLKALDVRSVSGDVRAEGLDDLTAASVSGDIEAQRVDARIDISGISGDTRIGAYSGSECRITSVSGDVHLTATPAADGGIEISTVSGDVTTRGTRHLDERVSTVSGDRYRR
ncbi:MULTISPECIES: DUF4097 family beta strand repeat-containing protein [unclassified Streptomyces]|uniref:DUF4097 family beta strand repeat-containing protein n=1 Tax=unclassified Streptomyces TaxID=2593676 RepID=UPI0004BD3B56|nr:MULTISPECIES: DUF4097 family beta strand repeat-containing protein [unclassified Streptomyces]